MNNLKKITTVLFVLCAVTLVQSQNCALSLGSTSLVSQNGNVCQYRSIINFSATNTNSANSITITTNNGSIVMVANPANVQDASVAFSFTSNFNGNYTITYNVPCNQSSIDFSFAYDGPGNGDCTITSDLISLSPLPVSMGDFQYAKHKDNVKLSWNTYNEFNNHGFSLEKSKDGEVFEKVKFIPSNSQNSGSSYRTEVTGTGMYYRLIQVDIDGRETVAGMLYVPTDEDFHINISQQTVTADVPENALIQLEIIDINGQIVAKSTESAGSQHIDIQHLRQGVYYTKVITGDKIKSVPFIKY
jgi:hypothetical protein